MARKQKDSRMQPSDVEFLYKGTVFTMKKYERVYKHRIDNRSTKVYIYGSPS
jgi:hypothetical protein